MLNSSDLEILDVFKQHVLSGMTIRAISLALKKPYPHVHRHIGSLIKNGILAKRVVGASHECFVDLASEKGRLAISIAVEQVPARHRKTYERLDKKLSPGSVAVIENDRLIVISEDAAKTRACLKSMKPKLNATIVHPEEYFSERRDKLPLILTGTYDYFTWMSRLFQGGAIR